MNPQPATKGLSLHPRSTQLQYIRFRGNFEDPKCPQQFKDCFRGKHNSCNHHQLLTAPAQHSLPHRLHHWRASVASFLRQSERKSVSGHRLCRHCTPAPTSQSALNDQPVTAADLNNRGTFLYAIAVDKYIYTFHGRLMQSPT